MYTISILMVKSTAPKYHGTFYMVYHGIFSRT